MDALRIEDLFADAAHDAVVAGVALGLVAAVVGAAHAAKIAGAPTEWTRKAVHAGVGVISAFAPAFMRAPYVAIAGGVLLSVVFFAAAKSGRLRAVNGVKRASCGAWAFPLAGTALLVVTGGQGPLYVVPMLVVAFADTAAALVGRPFGRRKLPVGDGAKTLEGTLAFAAAAFAATAGALLAVDVAPGRALLVAAAVAASTAAAEALSHRGWDNAVVPAVAYGAVLAALGEAPAASATGVVVAGAACLAAVLHGVAVRGPAPRARAVSSSPVSAEVAA